MKKGWLIFFVILTLLAYLLGNIIPYKVFVPNIDWNKTISSGDLFYYFINTIQAIGTVGAVIVALFSDTIKCYFRKPELAMSLHCKDLMEELDNCNEANLKAKRYYNFIDIFNNGNINAENCEIYIDRILFQGLGMKNPIELIQNELLLYWNGNENRNNTYIPVQGKKSFLIYEIYPPEEQGTPGGGNTSQVPPQLIIGNYKVPNEYCGSKWEIIICLYSPSLKPQKIKVVIEWDGSWEYRQMEMKGKVKNSIEQQ